MLKKIRMMLKQQEGFTLMELMIVVVIIGILAGIAVPIYNGVQNRAKEAVGEANVTMLNRGMKQLKALGYKDATNNYVAGTEFTYTAEQLLALKAFLGLTEAVKYVKWDTNQFVIDATASSGI